jgi:uncharacterized protein (TIGR00251 family)
MTTTLTLTNKDGSVRFEVHAKPRAKKSRIGGVRADGSLEVALAAPPVDGAANEELVRFLAKVLEVPRAAVTLVRGESSRTKLVAVAGRTPDEVRERFRREPGEGDT